MRFVAYFLSSYCCFSLATCQSYQNATPPEYGPTEWDAALAKAKTFVDQLSVEEKVGILTGAPALTGLGCIGNIAPIPRLGFGGLCLLDGPTAINRAELVTIFPAGLTVAATWDKDMMYQRGFALGEEFKAKGAHVALGPVAGPLGRHPLGGRNWEGFSPDPYLTGVAMDATIRGQQKAGVQTCSKHYIGNEQETQRSNTTMVDGSPVEAISSNIDDRTLHELYLWPFADAVRAGTTSVMCSYNRFNQTYACENSDLLNNILKKELGFRGYVVSDWFATHSGVESANAGLDMEMPGLISTGAGPSYFGPKLTEAVNNGSVSIERIDDMARRVMTPYFLLGQDNSNYPTVDPSTPLVLAVHVGLPFEFLNVTYPPPARDVRRNHSALVRQIGAAGTVLLKNIDSTLPLKYPRNIGVFGSDAADLTNGLTFVEPPGPANPAGFEIGTLDIGGGSGSGRHSDLVSPLEAIKRRGQSIGARVQYILSNERLAANDFHSIYQTPDICLVFLKTYAAESFDRQSFEADWNSTLVVNNVAKRCPNTVVITHSGGVNTMPWASNPNVKAILAAHYPGEQTGNAIVDVLWGDVNPSGKLPYTIPAKESDYDLPIVNLTSVASPDGWQSNFSEGLLIDYRHFDKRNVTPLYEFGYGLSYTTFDIASSLSVSPFVTSPASTTTQSYNSSIPGGNPDLYAHLLRVTTSVSNTGSLEGATVLQLYVTMPQDTAPVGTPVQVLRGFEKVNLQPGESREVQFELTRRDLSYWDVVAQTWRIPAGEFEIRVGFSSRDVRSVSKYTVLMA